MCVSPNPVDLAAGYHVSDLLIQRAIEVDHKQGISSKFLAYMNKLDSKVGSTGTSYLPQFTIFSQNVRSSRDEPFVFSPPSQSPTNLTPRYPESSEGPSPRPPPRPRRSTNREGSRASSWTTTRRLSTPTLGKSECRARYDKVFFQAEKG